MASGHGMSFFRRFILKGATAASLAAGCVLPLAAQQPPQNPPTPTASLRGSVRDSSGAPIGFASIFVAGIRGIADSSGRFHFFNLAPGSTSIFVRRLGFTPQRIAFTLVEGRADSIHLILTTLPFELAGINTEAPTFGRMADFERHRVNGQGIYLDRAELEKRRTPRLSDVLRRVPGVRIVTDRAGRTLLRMGRSSMGRDCPPEFWIDGVRAQFLGVDDVPVSDIEALEVYRGPSGLPPEFNSRFTNAQCGAIIIWTRVPG